MSSGLLSRAGALYSGLPRAGRWLFWAVAGAGAYFGIVEPTLDATNALATQADASKLWIDRAVDQADRRTEADSVMALNVSRFGEVLPPGEFNIVAKDLDIVVDDALKARGVTGYKTTKRRPSPLGREAMTGVLPANREVQRIGVEVSFEATAELVAAVVADLERSPSITAVSEVNLKSGADKKKVQATIVPEAWIFVEKGARR